MSSRDKILAAVGQSQPAHSPLPDITFLKGDHTDLTKKFTDTLTGIGGQVISIISIDDVRHFISHNLIPGARKVTTIPLLSDILELVTPDSLETHSLQNVENAIIEAHFAVAENGAVWVTEDKLHARVLPFITQHLAIIVKVKDLVPTMHEAYEKIGNSSYGFGTFIAGPSKTADIEQSLVLGAHGARSMTVFLME